MKISRKRLKEIVEEEMREGRVITPGVANDLTTQMNNLAGALQKFDPSALQGQPASDLRAAWVALESSMSDVFGDGLENAAVPIRKPLEECGMTDEPLPMPGPPPEPNRALEPVYDDDEGHMATGQLSRLVNDAGELTNLLGGQTQLPSWVQAKVTKATDYISAVKNYLQYQQQTPQGLHEMKITKERLAEIVKEEMQLEAGGDPVGPVEAKKMAELLQNLGFTLTRGGENSLIDFLQGLESQGDLSATPDSRRGALAEESEETPLVDREGAVLKELGLFLAKLANEGHDELASELDKILVKFPEEWRAPSRGLEEAGRPHSMRGGRTMADLDKDAKTRETDFLKKKEEEEETNESKMKISKQRLAEIIKEEYNATLKEAEFVGHHAEIDGETYVDSNFLNSVKKIRDTFPGELKSMGHGEFYLETPKGKVQFDRSRGQSVQGTVADFVGRAHQLYGEPPELADELMAAMEAAGASEAVSIVGVGGSDSEGYSKVAGTRPMEEERGEPGEQPPYPSVKQDPAEVEKIADLMANDPEFEMFRQHVEKFKKYAQSGGSAVSSLESALPEYMPGQLIQKLINKVRPPGPKTPMGMPDLAGVEGDYDDPADKKKGGGYDFSKRFARTLAKEKEAEKKKGLK